MPQINPIPTYLDLGFSRNMEKSLATIGVASGGQSSSNNELNFDRVQTSGGLGDKIKVGNITIDGAAGKIQVDDGSGNEVITIGEIE